ncbi:MAG: NAD(P)/FAD-dependent oxidoreductase [Lachnospiraceae bacterium]|nr:NAD(P)/FAD-dependent oxidoreductase [Lachnospiraceae bacterium]
MKTVVVIGGGAAGMMAAIECAGKGAKVSLYEKNDRLGKKLFITGKGRCNLTNACDMEDLLKSVMKNHKFMYSAFQGFNNWETIGFFEDLGLSTKIERGNRVFPQSDHSSDVIKVLEQEMKRQGVQVFLNKKIINVNAENEKITGITLEGGKTVKADAVIVATGGLSYPLTGSTGDGFRFAKALGHKVTDTFPALVPMETKEAWVPSLQGLSLKNVEITIKKDKKVLYQEFGEMLFTHYGVSGPLILSASSIVLDELRKGELTLKIDLKPALSEEQLDDRILRDFNEGKNKQFRNVLGGLLPAKMIPVVIALSGISPEKKVNEINKKERRKLLETLKGLTMTLTDVRGYTEAIITRGGVDVKEISPSTMESKKVTGLYFAGEVLDVDAVTGGFNLQIAWSTAMAAARAAAQEV